MSRSALLFMAGLALCACQPQATPVPGVFPGGGSTLATVNGEVLTSDMVDSILRSLPAQIKQQLDASGDQSPLIDSLVASELLYQEAVKASLHLDPLVQQDIALAERHALAEAQARKIVKERMTDQRVQAWYDAHKVQFAQPQLLLAHIMFTDKAKADEVKAQLDAGGDFGALATANSIDTMTAPNGGEIGWLELKQMAPALRGQIQDAAAGSVIGPLEMGRTVHIFKVQDRRDVQPLEEVREDIESQIEQELRQEYLDELKAAALVVETYKAPTALPDLPADDAAGEA
ncbi:MAG: peptidyl-prolyl cis-trans isomerase, partial [Pseudomonadota bacterium]